MKIKDSKPKLEWIKLTSLYIPTDYQRSIKSDASQRNISRIKQNFNWAECGALTVCPLKNSKPQEYAIIDGQHRYKAALLHGEIKELPCVVIDERDMPSQAKNFISINENRVSLHILHKYQAMIMSGDIDAMALADILKKCKIAIASHAFSGSETPPNVTMAVGTLLSMMKTHSEKQVSWALTTITEAYPDKNGMMTANLIRVLVRFIKENPDADKQVMIETLQRLDMETLKKDASIYRKIEGGSVVTAMLRVIEKKYNSKKKAA